MRSKEELLAKLKEVTSTYACGCGMCSYDEVDQVELLGGSRPTPADPHFQFGQNERAHPGRPNDTVRYHLILEHQEGLDSDLKATAVEHFAELLYNFLAEERG